MSTLHHRTNQAAFDAAFGSLSAAQAADIILGRRPLTAEQAETLRMAEGTGGYGLRFDPCPVGHIAFSPVETRGTGNHGWHRLVPASAECRRLVNASRRDEFARRLGAPRSAADRLFSELRGHGGALAAAVAVWPIISICPGMSNAALREAGFRPGHPIEGLAIKAVRAVLGTT
ncbi:MAG: hypothetical protein RLZZ11_123 [Cyanobacteriota bacterium]|jgi:hypothetical protein